MVADQRTDVTVRDFPSPRREVRKRMVIVRLPRRILDRTRNPVSKNWLAHVPLPGTVAKTILVADDNPTIRKMLCRMFEIEEDYDLCAEAENGRQAIELALRHGPDLIILDLSMPVMNGLKAAHELKKLMPRVPIILFTQHSDLGSRIGVMNVNVDRIVSKSEASTLMAHVRALAPAA